MTNQIVARLAAVLLLAAMLPLSTPTGAQPYPSKPIRLIVPYPAGGGTDAFARAFGAKMGEILGQPVIIENKPGASSIIGAEFVAKSAPDGYTMLLGDNATYALNVSLYRKIPYDPLKDLAPVTLTMRAALLLVVLPSLPAQTTTEFINWARSRQGSLSFGSPGPGTPHHLAMELFKQRTGLNIVHIPYKGGAPATQDFLSGQFPVMMLDLISADALMRSGKIRAIAIANAQRHRAWPDVPTLAESGVPGYEATAWQGFSVPAGTPRDVIARLNAAYAKATSDAALAGRFEKLGVELIPSTPEQMSDHMRSEITKWAAAVKAGNIALD